MRIYIDTSVINGLYTRDERIKEITKQFLNSVKFGHFILYGSEIVSIEEVKTLASYYIENKIIPAKYRPDALHIACCAVHNIPILVSWNFEHIVKHKTRIEVNRINQKLGWPQIDLCSPEEV